VSAAPGEVSGTLRTLQLGRAIAAVLVVLHHNGGSIFALERYWGHDPLRGFFDFGSAGVEFFFVLSGFIIFHVHWRDLGQPGRFLAYARKRFLRIYPIYWLVLIPLALVYLRNPAAGPDRALDPALLYSSFLLVHFNYDYAFSILPVAWTLYHEILFYAVFALLIFSRRLGLALLALWLAGSLVMIDPAVVPHFEPVLLWMALYYFAPLHLLFAMGMVVCWLIHRGRVAAPWFCTIGGALLFLAAGLESDYLELLTPNVRSLVYGLGSAVALAGAVELERQGRVAVPRFAQLAGDASYSIYLLHLPALSLLAKLLGRPGLHLPLGLAYLLVPTLAVGAGILLHLWVEKPLLARLNGWFSPQRTRNSVAAAK
jgi:peptidoglycan/LPS O-acetylase OafA/YrhL